MTLTGQQLADQVVQARWMSAQDTTVPLSNVQVVQFASGTGVNCFHHELMVVPAFLRRIAAVLPVNEEADRRMDEQLRGAYRDIPVRKIVRR